MTPPPLSPHDGHHQPARREVRPHVDAPGAVEIRTRERFELAGNLHASMIVENVDPAMSIVDPRDQPLECAVVGHIEPFPIRFATLALNPLGGFRRPLPVAVRRDHIGPFARHDFGAGPANA